MRDEPAKQIVAKLWGALPGEEHGTLYTDIMEPL